MWNVYLPQEFTNKPPKNRPTLKNKPTPFVNKVVAKGAPSLKSMPTYLCRSTILSKKY